MPGDEEAKIKRAKAFGFSKIIFVDDKIQKIEGGKTAIYAKPGQVRKAQNKADYVIAKSSDKDRLAIEEKPFMIIGIGENPYKGTKGVSGINQVICKLAVNNNVIFGFSLYLLLQKTKYEQGQLMNRWMHIAEIARKYGVKCRVVSEASKVEDMRDAKDIKAFEKLLGIY